MFSMSSNTPQTTTEALRTVNHAAGRFDVKDRTVRAWMAARRITFVRLGRAVRIPESEIERLISEGTVPRRKRA